MSDGDYRDLDRIANALNCSESTREMARAIYHRAQKETLQEERSSEIIGATALYIAARLEHHHYDLGEVAAAARADPDAIERFYTELSQRLDLDTQGDEPSGMLSQVCSTLGVGDHLRSLAHEIVGFARGTGVVAGCSPNGVAAGAVYFASRLVDGDDGLTQDDISDAVQASKVTIRSRSQDYEDVLGIERRTSRSQLAIDGSSGLSAQRLNEDLSRFTITDIQPALFESRARCCRCGYDDSYEYLLRNHQPERLGGTQLCYEEGFSAADLADQLERFDAVDRNADFDDTHLRCHHCGETGPYREMRQCHHTQQLALGGPHVCYEGEPHLKSHGTTVAEQVEQFETKDAEFEIVESRSHLDDLRIRCVHCGTEGRYGDLVWQHETHSYEHTQDTICSDRSY